MIGTIIGDIVGSKYEFNPIKSKSFPLFSDGCIYTDDTIMTIAVAKALMISRNGQNGFKESLIEQMRLFGKKYPHPQGGYGSSFNTWLCSENPEPYNSFGNGSAMRVSPCADISCTLTEALALAESSAEVTHNHPEGIKGAKAVAAAIFLAREKSLDKEGIRSYICENYYYPLSHTLDEIRPSHCFDETCQITVPAAIEAFVESSDFEDAIRNAVSLGGDSDTLAAITGSIAWPYYCGSEKKIITKMKSVRQHVLELLPEEFVDIIDELESMNTF